MRTVTRLAKVQVSRVPAIMFVRIGLLEVCTIAATDVVLLKGAIIHV